MSLRERSTLRWASLMHVVALASRCVGMTHAHMHTHTHAYMHTDMGCRVRVTM